MVEEREVVGMLETESLEASARWSTRCHGASVDGDGDGESINKQHFDDDDDDYQCMASFTCTCCIRLHADES